MLEATFEIVTGHSVWGHIEGDILDQQDLQDELTSITGALSDSITGLDNKYDSITGALDDKIDSINGALSDSISAVDDKYNSITGSLSDSITALDSVVSSNFTTLSDSIVALDSVVSDNYNTLDGKIDSINGALSDSITALDNKYDSIIGSLSDSITGLDNKYDSITGALSDSISGIDSVISGYGDIVTHNVSEFADSTQGALADTALQPNDNISELVNDVGYITSSAVKDGILTIQKNGTDINTFSANSSSNVTMNITVPTQASDVNALPDSTKYGKSIDLSLDTTDYKLTLSLKDQDGTTLNSKVVDFPIESVVVNGAYDNVNKKIILTLQNGNTIDVPVGDLVAGLQTEITSSNKLDADLVDDTTATHKFATSSQLSQIATNTGDISSINSIIGGYGDIVTHNASEFATSTQGGKADSAIQSVKVNGSALTPDANKAVDITVPTKISNLSDDTATYPIDKADTLTGLTATIAELNYVGGVTSSIQTQLNGKVPTTRTVNSKALSSDVTLNLADLGNVTISSPTTGQNLTYDGVSQVWKNTSVSATIAWGGITGTLSDQTDLQNALNGKVSTNTAITGATRCKITYDAKGLVTSGADLQASDIPNLTLAKITDVTASTSELNILDGATLTTTELNYVDGVTSSIQTQLNNKLEKKPDGTNDLIDNNKINLLYVPDVLLGQVIYAGVFNGTTAVATLTTNAKTKLGTTANTITLTNDTTAITGYEDNEGCFYICNTDGTFASISFLVGDWLLSTGSGWSKVDNTDAVTGVKGNAESTYRIGNVNITADNVLPTQSENTGKFLKTNGTNATWGDAIVSVSEGSANGTISVDGSDVAVHGLGSAAYTSSSDYATSIQGGLADTAVQPAAIANMQTTTNLVTSFGSTPSDSKYPSEKLVYDTIGNVESILQNINSGT